MLTSMLSQFALHVDEVSLYSFVASTKFNAVHVIFLVFFVCLLFVLLKNYKRISMKF